MVRTYARAIAVILVLAGGAVASAQESVAAGKVADMPVKEVTVFKDGHAFVLHEGAMPTNGAGQVVMDYLPAPVMGAFWPYSAQEGAKLTAVVAGKRRVAVTRTALTTRELIEANIGAQAWVRETGGAHYKARIVGVPTRSSAELALAAPANTGESLPQKAALVLLETDEGIRAVLFDQVRDVTFPQQPEMSVSDEQFRNTLTLKLNWANGQPREEANVGMAYLQKGIRWIPSYKVTIDGEGKALVQLQATIINELTDLEGVTANLVVGVPTFAFQDVADPIGMGQAVAQLSQQFRSDARTAYAFSNAIMSQSVMPVNRRVEPTPPAGGDLGPEIAGSDRSEDLFIFTVENLTLRKGERAVLPVASYDLPYTDVHALDVPFAPPLEVERNLNSEQQRELARLFAAPKVMHKLRLRNTSDHPLTTAPALILKGDRLVAQGLMTYAAPGAETDLPVTVAVNIQVIKEDAETKRTPNAANWHGTQVTRIDLAGTIHMVNRGDKSVSIEVTRHVLGHADEAGQDGVVTMANAFEQTTGGSALPHWWRWYSWPQWWRHFNGIGRIEWTVELEPGKDAELTYVWHYFGW